MRPACPRRVATLPFLPGGAFGDFAARVSLGRPGDLEGDDIFVLRYAIGESELADLYASNPLRGALPAVRAGRVHRVGGTAWTNGGVLALQSALAEAANALAA